TRSFQATGNAVYQELVFAEALECIQTSDSPDAPHAGSDRLIAGDLEYADIARGSHVSATAKLARKNVFSAIYGKHADLLTIFFAEERHGARAHRILNGHLVRLHRFVAQNVVIH